ncbi:formyl transferase [Planctomycetes bacterium K23_9]|uniref:phosphoribosylglycinamide formyltransferase 1 n=1 Tax=Stieleria marina TaxID=1930275 RepID=A0A517NYR9_9BACT|nr:phosphoribosylglycinamide formyltransferase [Planctomycetes bacterium K23_9]
MAVECDIVLLCGDGESSRAVYHALAGKFGSMSVVMEQGPSRMKMYRRRCKTLGWRVVFGQLCFLLGIVPWMKRCSFKRSRELQDLYQLDITSIPTESVDRVASVNAEDCRQLLARLQPKVVVVNGTRIIGKKTLGCCDATFINTHHGITPTYRGVHGGYWALAEGKPEDVGSTIHLVDEGIDTGGAIRYVHFEIAPNDNFTTYPIHHIGTAIPKIAETVQAILAGQELPREDSSGRRTCLRSHPTVFQYLYYRFSKSVK